MIRKHNYDVIVIGSGPAGSTASTLLAQKGHDVLMIDRDQHPRFHIGESLLPMGEPIFKRLGIKWDKTQYLPKNGAEFINEKIGKNIRFPLASIHQPHQVDRANLDLMMLSNAQSQGAQVHQGESVRQIDIDKIGVKVTTNKSEYQARYLIDSSGRSTVMGRKLQSIIRIKSLGQFALYGHYKNAVSESAKQLYESGDIKILIVDIGWIWIIPLANQRLSVGLVVQDAGQTDQKGQALFEKYIDNSSVLIQLLKGSEIENQVRAEADFSYYNSKRYGERFACCGDASGFLDPIFSSGVFMAITSAQRIADTLAIGLSDNREADVNLQEKSDEAYLLGFNSMFLFIERFYNHDLVGRLLFESERNSRVKNNIMGLLAGDLWTGTNEFQNNLLISRQSQKSII